MSECKSFALVYIIHVQIQMIREEIHHTLMLMFFDCIPYEDLLFP